MTLISLLGNGCSPTYFGSMRYLYTHSAGTVQFCSVTTTLSWNSTGVGTCGVRGGGGTNEVLGAAGGWSLLLEVSTAMVIPSPATTTAKTANAAMRRLTTQR